MGANMGLGLRFQEYELPQPLRISKEHSNKIPPRVDDELEIVLWQFGLDPDEYHVTWSSHAVEIAGPSLDPRLQAELLRRLNPLIGERNIRFQCRHKKVRDIKQYERRRQRRNRARERQVSI